MGEHLLRKFGRRVAPGCGDAVSIAANQWTFTVEGNRRGGRKFYFGRKEDYFTPLDTLAGRNSSPAFHVGSFGAFATFTPIRNPNRAYCSMPEKSQSSEY